MKRNILGKALSVFLVATMALSNSVTGYAAASGTEEAIEIEVSDLFEDAAEDSSQKASEGISDEANVEASENDSTSESADPVIVVEEAEAVSESTTDVTDEISTDEDAVFSEDIGYKLSGGTLTITGSGDMMNYGSSNMPWYKDRDSIKKVVVGDKITRVGDYAFYDFENVTEVVLPSSLREIGRYSFSGTGISEVTIPENVTTIDFCAFSDNKNLNTVNINSVLLNSLAESIFAGCSINRVTFAKGIESIPGKLFYSAGFSNCTITIPASVISIGDQSFNERWSSTGISGLVFEKGSKLTTIGEDAFYGNKIASLELPESLTTIESDAFADNQISKIRIPKDVTTLGSGAFSGCKNLTTVIIDSNVIIGGKESVFAGCSINSVTFPKGMESIPSKLFYSAGFNNCTITIPASVTTIEDQAFNERWSGTGISGLVFEKGSNLSTIGSDAFYGNKITKLELPKSLETIGGGAFSNILISEITIPENVTTIGTSAFSSCKNLRTIKIDSKVIVGGKENIFENCNIGTVVFPEGIESIPNKLFYGAGFNNCTITIPASVASIGDQAFNERWAGTGINGLVFEEGSGLGSIGEDAFYGNKITKLELPQSLETIGGSAFAANLISEITIPQNVTNIGGSAFYACQNLRTVNLQTKNLIGGKENIFNGCSIRNVSFPSGIETIPNKLFYGAGFNNCTITIPATVTVIGDQAFNERWSGTGISGLTFEAGSKLSSIGNDAFYGNKITKLELPSTLEIIGSEAFANTLVSEVVIPGNVTKIGYSAFYGCANLKKITIPGSVKEIGNSAFTTTEGKKIKCYVVKGTYAYEWVEENASKYNYEIVSSSAINYELGGGTNNPANPTAYEKGESITLKDPTRIGYTFLGWFSDSKFTNKVTKVDTSTGKDLTFHAKWEANEYTVTYDVNANDAVLSGNKSFTLKYDTVYPKTMSTATRDGYKFDGWYTEAEGGTKIVPGTTKFNLSTPDNAKIYAHWTGITYTVRFNSNPATGKSKTTTQNFEYGKKAKLTKNSFTQKGVTFSGWNTEKDGSGTAFADEETVSNLAKVNKAVVDLYAQWKGTDYVVFFDAGSKDAVSGSLAKGERSYGALTDDEYEALGFKLSGVNTDNGFLQAMSYGDEFELSGDEFVRTGYVLTGWKNKNTGKAVKNGTLKNVTEKQEVVVLEAQWKLDNYKFSYNLNGGKYVAGASKGVAKYSVSTNTGIVYLPNCDAAGIKTKDLTVTKTGYVFEGWYDNAAFTGTQYTYVGITSDAEKAAGKEDVLKNTTFFAKWSPVTYFVTYNANGGKLEIAEADATVTLVYNENYQLDKESVSREGYTLEGWTLAADGTGKKLAANAKIKNLSTKDGETVTVYAKWKAVKNYKPSYKVTYSYEVQDNANVLASGTVVNKNSKLITSGKAYKLSKPTANGYTFLGWKGEGAVTTDSNGYVTGIKADNTATVSLVGVFKENTYNIKLSSNGGNYTVTGKTAKLDVKSGVKYTENVATDLAKLSDKFTKKGYALVGIALDAKGKNVLVYKDGSVNTLSANAIGGEIARLSAKNNGTVTLNAVWEKVVAEKPVITGASAKNGKAHVTYSAGATMADTTYEVQVSSSIIFKKSVTNTVTVSGKTADVALVGNKANYVRVRQIKTDSLGNKVTGQWSRRASVSK